MEPVIYQLFPRNWGTFNDISKELERLKSLNIDIIYLLPIHPIGEFHRKGSLGSPYAIRDYKAIDSSFGTFDDFKNLINQIHQLGMKIIMDSVINHTAKDSVWVRDYPQWFCHDKFNQPTCKVKAWTDVCDLNYDCPEKNLLIREIIQVFGFWLEMGIDGFRCDVASKIPDHVWESIFEELRPKYPSSIWISESFQLNPNYSALLSDAMLLKHFDYTYDYTLWRLWNNTLQNNNLMEYYIDHIRLQLNNKEKQMRFIENHDTKRLLQTLSHTQVCVWLAFFAFLPGSLLVYDGIEFLNAETPSLFEKTPRIKNRQFSSLPEILNIKRTLKNCDEIFFTRISPLVIMRRNSITGDGYCGTFIFSSTSPTWSISVFQSRKRIENYKSNLFN